MSRITAFYLAMLTRSYDDAGTDSPVELIANFNGVDVIDHTYRDTVQSDQEKGQANLYRFRAVRDDLDTGDLDHAYFRVGIRGDDAWQPEHFALWCTAEGRFPVVPVAFDADVENEAVQRSAKGAYDDPHVDPARNVTLSTDDDDDKGDTSIALHRIGAGNRATVLRHLLVVMDTHNWHSYGTDNQLRLQITAGGVSVVDTPIYDTEQNDQDQGEANLYLLPVDVPFTRGQLQGGTVRLFISGTDNWLPTRFFIFGLNDDPELATLMVPLVHMENWGLGELTTAGQPFVNLPLAL